MNNLAVEKFLDLKLSDIKEMQPDPFMSFVLIKTNNSKGDFKINIPSNKNFIEEFDNLKKMVGFEKKKVEVKKKKKRIAYYELNGILYTEERVLARGMNVTSLNNAIRRGRSYYGQNWKKLVLKDGQLEYKSWGKGRELFLFRCRETNEIKDTKTWTRELRIHRNTLTKNVRENYKTRGLTFERISVK